MRYLNYWDNKNFWGAKSGPLTHASSVNLQFFNEIVEAIGVKKDTSNPGTHKVPPTLWAVLCRLSIYSQSQSISINFNPFQSLSIPNLNGDWDWIVNPIFWGRLGLSQSQSFTFANRWFCPIYVSEIHKKVLCQISQMLDLSCHISSEYTFSFSCRP